MNNDEIRQLYKLTGIAAIKRKVRRNFHLWTPEQSDRILYLIEVANREIDRFNRERTNQKPKQKSSSMRTFHAARLDALEREKG